MSVVTPTQFNLIRSRRFLERAFAKRDWHAVREWDRKLAQSLNDVFDDPDRNSKALLSELETVLATYGRLLAELPDESMRRVSSPSD